MRLLLVEDNADLAENLAEIFEAEGLFVVRASDGSGALRAAKEGFDLALVDVRLPDTVGTSLLPALHQLSPDAAAIVLTGNADVASAIEAVQAGAFAYLTKPVAVQELLLTVSRAKEQVRLRHLSRELQASLEASERRHRSIVEAAPTLIVALDRALTIRFVNRFVEEATGWREEELSGRSYFDLLALPDQEEPRQSRYRPGGEPYEVGVVCRDGRSLRVQWQWTQAWLRPTDGTEELLYGIGADVTRQRTLERERQVAEKLAAVGQMTAGLAHEIRNPLNSALLQLTLLSRRVGRLSEEGLRRSLSEPVELVCAELTRLSDLLNNFLAFAKPREYRLAPVELSELLRRVVTLEQESGRARGISLTLEAEEGLTVAGDNDALQQVFLNLIKNALEVARAKVSVSARRGSQRILVTVLDDGPGIPAPLASRVFEPFFTTKPQGTGLGLAIVHSILLAHGGEVSLLSHPAGGAVAEVRLLPATRPGT